MELSQLYYFSKIAKQENIAQAAKELYVSQPTLSRSISKLEEELGVHLFERTGNKIKINQFGKRFEVHVDRIIQELADAQKELNALNGKNDGNVRIALPHTGLLGRLIVDYVRLHSDVCISQVILPINEAKTQLLNGQLDFALSFVPPGDERFLWYSYGSAGMSVMLSEQHPLYSRKHVDLRELKSDSFIINNSNTDLNTIFQTAFQEAEISPKVIFGGDEPKLISSLVKDNCGVFLIPDVVNRLKARDPNPFGSRHGYRFIPLSFPQCSISFGICTLRDNVMKPQSQSFYEHIRSRLSDILTDRYLSF